MNILKNLNLKTTISLPPLSLSLSLYNLSIQRSVLGRSATRVFDRSFFFFSNSTPLARSLLFLALEVGRGGILLSFFLSFPPFPFFLFFISIFFFYFFFFVTSTRRREESGAGVTGAGVVDRGDRAGTAAGV